MNRGLQHELDELERTDPAVRTAGRSYDDMRRVALWRASMADEIEVARAASRASIQTGV